MATVKEYNIHLIHYVRKVGYMKEREAKKHLKEIRKVVWQCQYLFIQASAGVLPA